MSDTRIVPLATVTNVETTAAALIAGGFRTYRAAFTDITLGARHRFLARDWQAVQDQSRHRIHLYKASKLAVCEALVPIVADRVDWSGVRQAYTALVADDADVELAGTFYNSIYRHFSHRADLDDRYAFVSIDPGSAPASLTGLTVCYRGSALTPLIRELLTNNELGDRFTALEDDVEYVADKLKQGIPLLRNPESLVVEMVAVNFYRNKGAYLVGQVIADGHCFPIALAVAHDSRGILIDAALWGEARLSVVFSFTRTYFMVDAPEPAHLVNYLGMLLPEKKPWELYTSLGFFKHGKTGFIRGLRHSLDESSDSFVVAEGIRGQIMVVFALVSYQTVFKLMKDKFPATKRVSHEDVRRTYQLVKTHDRVGRMADTQEFHNLTLPRNRFDPALLDEMCRVAASAIEISADAVTIHHLYTERLMTPLNIYINRCSEFQLRQVLIDYGHAIRDLAAANIFPGDMLLKNFGVTRHGRVVFYDYDEICYLTQVNFREMPAMASSGMSAEPWFDVGEYDVFPEEFATFLFPDEIMQTIFREQHGDLLTAAGWRAIQDEVRRNVISDVYPYPAQERRDPGFFN